jgi:hypothetical protein
MGRRCRHISWKAIGAAQAFDARQISGVTDGTAVGTWTDIGTGGNDASQATTSLRPIYRAGANGINGGPVLEFDGTDDFMSHSFSESTSSVANFVLAIATVAQTGSPAYYFASPPNQALRVGVHPAHPLNPGNKLYFPGWNFDGGAAVVSDSSLVNDIILSTFSGTTYSVSINGSWRSDATSGTGYSDAVDRRLIANDGFSVAACKIAICCTIQPVPSRAMLNRVVHAISRSYKVAAS